MNPLRKVRKIYMAWLSMRVFGRSDVTSFGSFKVGRPKNVRVGANLQINDGVYIQGRSSVQIGDNVTLSMRAMILDGGLDTSAPGSKNHLSQRIVIEDNVWIGAGSIVLSGVVIGRNSVIGAGSVVTNDIPPNVVAAGNPARVIREIEC